MSFEMFVPLKPGEIILGAGDGEIELDNFFSAKRFPDSKGTELSQFRNWRYVTLYFDREKRAIGIKPLERGKKPDASAYKVREGNPGLKIRCPSFLWLCQISIGDDSYRLRATWSQKERMLIARLEDEI